MFCFAFFSMFIAMMLTSCRQSLDGIGLLYIPEGTTHGYISINHILHMNDHLYGRVPFSYRELEAAEWIAEQLVAMGHDCNAVVIQDFHIDDVEKHLWQSRVFLEALGHFGNQEFCIDNVTALLTEQTLSWWEGSELEMEEFLNNQLDSIKAGSFGLFHDNMTFRESSQNVILTVPGQSERKIIVGAHYNSMIYPGASDNASGTALLLESAHRILFLDNYYTIVYVFFGAEELGGFLGANYYIESLTQEQRNNIIFMINADILFEGPYFFFGAAHYDGYDTTAENSITQQIEEIAYNLNATHSTELINLPSLPWMMTDSRVFIEGYHTVVNLAGYARLIEVDLDNFLFTVADVEHIETNGDWPAFPVVRIDGDLFGGRLVHSPMRGDFFGGRIMHSPKDDIHFINEHWPEKVGEAMRAFSLFLEAMLMAIYPY